jgi:hypothetical protein
VTAKASSCAHCEAALTEANQVLHGRYDKIDLPVVSGGVDPRLNGAGCRRWRPAAILGDRLVVRLCDENAVVLAAVLDAACILDRRYARQRWRAQVGTAGCPS